MQANSLSEGDSWLSNTFNVLQSDWNALTTFYTNPGQVASDVTASGEQAAKTTVNNIATGVLSMVPWWIWGVVALIGFVYFYPILKRR